ncbi:MAG: hypothetical protein WEC81_01875 [Patescibacteria group bacterium]
MATDIKLPNLQSEDFWKVCREKFPKEHDWLVSLVKSFRVKGLKNVLLDDRRMQHQIESCQFAEKLGLVTFSEIGSDEAQYTGWVYTPTELGKKVFLDPNAPTVYVLPG